MSDRIECCFLCGNPTGRAGLGEDSIYFGDSGPWCEECYDQAIEDRGLVYGQDIRSQLATARETIARLQERRKEAGDDVETMKKELATANVENERITKERDEARAYGEKLYAAWVEEQNNSRIITCAYCGEQYPPGTPESNHHALSEHIKKCPKHPMREAEANIERLKTALKHISEELHGQLKVGVFHDRPLNERVYWSQLIGVADAALRGE